MDAAAFKYIAIGFMAFGMFGAAIAVANVFAALVKSIARNPSAETKMAKYAMIGAGMAEAMGIFALGIAMILIFM
ncbi:MAG: F0F1 ATP synthase subunit C [Rickettsiales bacterium]|nr:F0F1 ATP synthase subunit C [Rickettsiales bacterium]